MNMFTTLPLELFVCREVNPHFTFIFELQVFLMHALGYRAILFFA